MPAINELYILTDAEGFTTACDATIPALTEEVHRRPMLAPITIVRWVKGATPNATGGWTRADTFMWSTSLG